MYDSGPSESELQAIGLEREDVTDNSDFEVWPENWLPFQIFNDVATQWRTSGGGPTGLDYGAVEWVMKLRTVPKKQRLGVLTSIRIMEASALDQIAANQKGMG